MSVGQHEQRCRKQCDHKYEKVGKVRDEERRVRSGAEFILIRSRKEWKEHERAAVPGGTFKHIFMIPRSNSVIRVPVLLGPRS